MAARIEITSEMLNGGIRVVKPIGQLDVFTFVEFKKYFEELCAQAKDVWVIVDLSAVEYIASSGWSVLLSRRLAFKRLGGNLSIFGLKADIRRVYDSMKINKMLPAAENIDDATKLLKEGDASSAKA